MGTHPFIKMSIASAYRPTGKERGGRGGGGVGRSGLWCWIEEVETFFYAQQ